MPDTYQDVILGADGTIRAARLVQERKDLIDQTYRLGEELAVEKLRRIKAEAAHDAQKEKG